MSPAPRRPPPLNQPPSSSLPNGFTLFELLVVLVILSVFMAFAMPSFRGMAGGVRGEAKKVASLLRYTNETAATKKEVLALKFDMEDGSVTPSEGEGLVLENLYGVELQSRGLVRDGEVTVLFSPTGPGEHIWVHLGTEGGVTTVYFNPVSGRARILGDEG